jgi:ornithine carbamoyltransferase
LSTRPRALALPHRAQPAIRLKTADLISIRDLSPLEVRSILGLAGIMKASPAAFRDALAGKQLALFFEKPSLRTRITFEAGISSMGGTSFFVDQTRSRLDEREKLSDISRNLERWVDGVVLRTFDHATVVGVAEHAGIPVINGLSDREHPCQALADFFTLEEKFADLSRVRLAYVGDGNNVAHSLMLVASSVGSHIRVATPPGHEPAADIVACARKRAKGSGGSVELFSDPAEAVAGTNAVYTDVWASMGRESEAEARRQIFAPYQVNRELMAHAEPGAFFLHCLPAHRGQEVTDEIMDSPQSVVFDQAENRLHVQKAILLLLLGNGKHRLHLRSAHA